MHVAAPAVHTSTLLQVTGWIVWPGSGHRRQRDRGASRIEADAGHWRSLFDGVVADAGVTPVGRGRGHGHGPEAVHLEPQEVATWLAGKTHRIAEAAAADLLREFGRQNADRAVSAGRRAGHAGEGLDRRPGLAGIALGPLLLPRDGRLLARACARRRIDDPQGAGAGGVAAVDGAIGAWNGGRGGDPGTNPSRAMAVPTMTATDGRRGCMRTSPVRGRVWGSPEGPLTRRS